MITLATTLTRCAPRRRRSVNLGRWVARGMMMLVLALLAAWVLHVVGAVHLAWVKHEARASYAKATEHKKEVAR